jgi:hypothetical protein
METQVYAFIAQHLAMMAVLAVMACADRSATAITLADNGRSDWRIRSSSADRVVSHAVAELRGYLKQLSGADFSVANDDDAKREIVVGLRGGLPADDQARLPVKKSGEDGYAIAIVDSPPRIVIGGDNPRGTLYGVYDLLERLGCRWYYPQQDPKDTEVVPRLVKVDLPAGAWAVASPIATRVCNGDAWFFKIDPDAAKAQIDWAMKNRYNVIGWQCMPSNQPKSPLEQYNELRDAGVLAELEKRGMSLHGPAHSFDHFLNAKEYFEKHSEWFGMRGGKRVPQAALGAQFCWSNSDARQEFVKNATEFVAAAPLVSTFCTIPFDGGPACECIECKKTGGSNLAMLLMGELIESVRRVRPDVVVEQVAGYSPLAQAPTDAANVPPTLRFIWAQWGRNHSIGYADPKYNATNLESWRAVAGDRLTTCQYYGDTFSQPWVMAPFTRAIVDDRRYFIDKQVGAVYMLMYPKGYWWNHGLNMSLSGRAFYDVSLDPEEEVRDYALHYFGPKAGPLMAEYYDVWIKNIDMSYRLRGGSTPDDRKQLADERKRLIGPAIEAVGSEAPYAYRMSKVAALHNLAERLADIHGKHDTVTKRRREGKFDEATEALAVAKKAVTETLGHFYAAADLNAGLADRDENTSFIKLVMQTWIDAEAKKIEANDRS